MKIKRQVRAMIRKAVSSGGCIYFVQGENSQRIKIGFSKDPVKRIAALATGCPEPIKVLGAIDGSQAGERALHLKFAHLRVVGEWFRNGPDLVTHIEAALATPGAVLRNPFD